MKLPLADHRRDAQDRDAQDQAQVGGDGPHGVAHCQVHLSLQDTGDGHRQLRQRGGQGHDGGADDKSGHAGGLRDPDCAVQKPVSALDDQQQPQ